MKKNIMIFVAVIALSAILTVQGSQAASINWQGIIKLNKSNDNTITEDSIWSFNQMYASLQNFTSKKDAEDTEDMPTIQETSLVSYQPVITVKSAPSRIKKAYTVSVSAYSSTVDQTDDSPFITASGTHVRDGIVAANFLPIGTAIKIPSVYGDKIFIVEDRMNSRYWYNVDIWFSERETAKQFGRKTLDIEVL